ncbi:MAG: Ribulose-phosphate 3-epimerase [Syntrophorhabdaceae bacterium PtaU1.Bin034]|jgi:ribulose-phosphate 3-epimerase|nr:MAG: Ribulose-phosphate 3-epimerase [Syntrophorhabdaceae bacterium PtaU1.Bin034]
MTISIAPSILSANFLRLEEEIRDVEAAGADLIHVDIMDGHFVPNLTIGPMIVKAIRRITTLPLDVHLMIENADTFVDAFADAGSDIITVHAETGYHHFRTIDLIKSHGKKVGFALNPGTPLSAVEEVISRIDLLLIMTVNPGFGGQAYIPSMTRKIARARQMLDRAGSPAELEVDGGVKAENAEMVAEAGATILVMGTEIFLSGDYGRKIADIKKRLQKWNS